jgi:hypothetical protein
MICVNVSFLHFVFSVTYHNLVGQVGDRPIPKQDGGGNVY